MNIESVIKIDHEFKALIPPLTPEEYAQLEINLVAEGCRDDLIVWLCREKEEKLEQQVLFCGLLQARYPAKRNDDEVYARPDDLSDAEVLQNVKRLKKEARAKDDHAVALLGYLNQRKKVAA